MCRCLGAVLIVLVLLGGLPGCGNQTPEPVNKEEPIPRERFPMADKGK